MNLNATLIAQLIVFLILVGFTIRYVWPPIAKALDERADKIAEGLAAAERGKSDFEQAETKVAELLARLWMRRKLRPQTRLPVFPLKQKQMLSKR